MRRLLCFTLVLGMLFSSFTVSNAASTSNTIAERPDIQVIINGVKGDYTNNPIIVNGRTLLPLRELLTYLGVANDDQHIIWDSKEKSVTALKDKVKISLKVGDANAKVNDEDVTIDAAPVNYNSRIFIPAKFVAEAFGMYVTWNDDTKTVQMQSVKNVKGTSKDTSVSPQSVSVEKNGMKFYALFPEIPSIDNITTNLGLAFAHSLEDYPEYYYYTYEADTWQMANKYAFDYVKLLINNGFTLQNYFAFDQPLYFGETGLNLDYQLTNADGDYELEVRTESLSSRTWLRGERDDYLCDDIDITITKIGF